VALLTKLNLVAQNYIAWINDGAGGAGGGEKDAYGGCGTAVGCTAAEHTD
jgi:hypothetical protein